MTKEAIIALLLVLGLSSTTIVLAETQQTEYVLELQGPTWDHSTINLIVTPRYNETWWNPAYLNATLHAISEWNEAISGFASNHSDFAYLSGARITPMVSNLTNPDFDVQVSWIQQFGNETCDAGLTRTTYDTSGVISNCNTALSAFDCLGNVLSETDMQNVFLHELGHCLGLGHCNYTGDTMYFAYSLNTPLRLISTLDAYGVAQVFRWMSSSSVFSTDNQGPTINSVALPSSIQFGYLQVSQENLPEQSPLEVVKTFAIDLLGFTSRPEILVLIIIAISAVAVFVILSRKRKRQELAGPQR